MNLDYAQIDAKAQTDASGSTRGGLEKFFKDPLLIATGQAGTGIGRFQDNLAVFEAI